MPSESKSSNKNPSSDQTILFYYSKSADKPPGKGANESLGNKNKDYFSELSRLKDWRKVLSNFHIGPFQYHGKTYRTAEHCFQSQKIALVSKTLADTFAMESKSKLSQGDGEEARKQRKVAILDESQLKQWNQMKHSVMEELLYCKFSQNEQAKKVLLATRDAELWHGARGMPKSRQYDLEKARARIVKEGRKSVSTTATTSSESMPSHGTESTNEKNVSSRSGETTTKKRTKEEAFDTINSSSVSIEPSNKNRKR
ncbi:hypothetical protein C9374_011988 [Naegleria lovaniensis]|uniref:NADAR domain-containing protein n=1 Tax=Naegleria lovaniensis TaxID=51637 RepID=A0AA88GDP1_NAELO|nr:uncharacterized protein C9374_011988 [Naegleria lovaniensis]KAG2373525.1 hypothetical protein C9374_011988 [Naegleria lovaniensis]